MTNAVTEIFLSEYFKIESIALPLFGDARKLFDSLYDAFLLPQEQKQALCDSVMSEEVRAVHTKNDYVRLRRMLAYTEIMGASDAIENDASDIIAIKGEALKAAAELGLSGAGQTPYTAYKHISEISNNGSLFGLRLVGLLQCSGVEMAGGSYRAGVKCLTKAAQWNCVEGLLLLMHYDESSRAESITRLSTVVHGTPFEELTALAEKKYGVKASGIARENKLLKKAFRACVLKPDVYSPQYARFLFGKALGIKDKEQLLFSDSKEIISETADLPLKLDGELTICDETDRKPLSAERENEFEKVLMCAMSGDLRTEPSYHPICICADSDYMRMRYADVVTSVYRDVNVEYIDVGALSEFDFEPTKNNIFVRSCNEDSGNIYVLVFVGDIRPGVFDAARNFLQTDKRKRFRLSRPCVEIDLSSVLPVCVCDKANAKALKSYCDMISVKPIGENEKREIIDTVIADLRARYGDVKLEIEQSAMKTLDEYSIDKAEDVIEKIIRFNRRKKKVITITADMLKEGVFGADNVTFGFGGRNENK